jgi:hypothetical protein
MTTPKTPSQRTQDRQAAHEREAKKRQDCRAILQQTLPPGSKIFAVIRSVAERGSRKADFYSFADGDQTYLNSYIETLCGKTRDREGRIWLRLTTSATDSRDAVRGIAADLSRMLHGTADAIAGEIL